MTEPHKTLAEITDPIEDTAVFSTEILDSEDTLPPNEASHGRPRKAACAITGMPAKKRDLVRLDTLRVALVERIRQDHPDLEDDAYIHRKQVTKYRQFHVEELLREEHGEFSELDRQVVESIANQDTIAENTEDEFEEKRTLGEKLSDGLASFGGSWRFLISFGFVLIIWMTINVALGEVKAFDPYPFILLNLLLSCIAAIQAPIIMMSQKRQEAKDRLRSFNDYRVNLKAELEIRHLHEKLDHLITKQWQRLAEIQQIQLEIMHDGAILQKKRKPTRPRKKAKKVAKPAAPASVALDAT